MLALSIEFQIRDIGPALGNGLIFNLGLKPQAIYNSRLQRSFFKYVFGKNISPNEERCISQIVFREAYFTEGVFLIFFFAGEKKLRLCAFARDRTLRRKIVLRNSSFSYLQELK